MAAPATARRRWPWASEAKVTVSFVGEVLLALGRALRGGPLARPLAGDVLHQLDTVGPRALPIVLMTCALVGMMLAYMGGAQLERIGTQSYLAEMVTVGMARELASLMTAIILAGRVGSAFAAHLATMQAGDEIDALRVLGISPVTHLVLPRLLALVLVGPLMIATGTVTAILAGWLPATLQYGVTTHEYFAGVQRAVNFTDVSIGLFKGMLYVVLVALAGCREGFTAGRSAEAIGIATTTAVVKALVWIVTAACGTTVVFTALGF